MDALLAARTLYTNSFKAFVKKFWNAVSPWKLIWGRHIDALCDHLQAVRDGKITNLLVNLPPRHSKSIICTILWPVWMWLTNPAEAVLSASYGTKLSIQHASKSRRLVESEEFKRLFPWVVLTDDTNAKNQYTTTAGGGRMAVSVGAGTTGFDATIIILDDLHSIKKKESEAERRNAISYYADDLSSRAVLGQPVRTVIIGQRVHAEDVSGWVIDNYRDSPGWSFLVLPLEYDPDRDQLPSRIGWKDWRTERGQILFPETVTPADVADFKIKRRHSYQCLYNQDVVNRDGDLFKAEWFRHYRTENGNYVLGDRVVRPGDCRRVAAVDIAVSTGGGNDWTVVVIADLMDGDLIVRHVHRERMDGVKFGPTVRALYDTYRPVVLAVEHAGQQKIYIDQLRQAGIPVRAVRPVGSKEDRSVTLQIKLEAGQVWFPAGAAWLNDLEAELLAFPRGRHDDQVDAMSMVANLGRYAARQPQPEPTEEELQRKQEAHFREMLMAGIG